MKAALLVFPVVLFLNLFTVAQPLLNTSAPSKKAPHPMSAEMRAEMRSNFLAKTGGFIMAPDKGASILFLNTQTRITADHFNEVGNQIQQFFRLSVSHKNVPSKTPVRAAIDSLNDTNIASVVVIGDSEGYPALLIAPESRWAMVNVSALDGKDASAEILADRTCKEVWRAFGYLMGAAHSNTEKCLMKPVLNPTDLDALSVKILSPEPLCKIMLYAKWLGMQPLHATTYRKAVEEGWGPMPTNAVQQAIWDELKK